MTESEVQPAEIIEDEPPRGPLEAHCRHCGQPHELAPDADPDWLCAACERFQDAMICPTCGQLARISLLDASLAPEPHTPAKRRRAKEDS